MPYCKSSGSIASCVWGPDRSIMGCKTLHEFHDDKLFICILLCSQYTEILDKQLSTRFVFENIIIADSLNNSSCY